MILRHKNRNKNNLKRKIKKVWKSNLVILDTTWTGDKTYSCDKEKGIYFIDGNKVTKEEYENQTDFFKDLKPISKE